MATRRNTLPFRVESRSNRLVPQYPSGSDGFSLALCGWACPVAAGPAGHRPPARHSAAPAANDTPPRLARYSDLHIDVPLRRGSRSPPTTFAKQVSNYQQQLDETLRARAEFRISPGATRTHPAQLRKQAAAAQAAHEPRGPARNNLEEAIARGTKRAATQDFAAHHREPAVAGARRRAGTASARTCHTSARRWSPSRSRAARESPVFAGPTSRSSPLPFPFRKINPCRTRDGAEESTWSEVRRATWARPPALPLRRLDDPAPRSACWASAWSSDGVRQKEDHHRGTAAPTSRPRRGGIGELRARGLGGGGVRVTEGTVLHPSFDPLRHHRTCLPGPDDGPEGPRQRPGAVQRRRGTYIL